MTKLSLGLQLYTLRSEMESDFLGTLRKVKEIGYAGVEFAGFGNESVATIKQLLREIDLKPISSHVPINRLLHDLDCVIEEHLELGCTYIVCPWLEPDARHHYAELGQQLEVIGATCRDHGLTLCYHHHDFEFDKIDDRYALDVILARQDASLLSLELDMYWVTYAGVSLLPYIEQYQGRVPLMHVKDMEDSAERAFAPVGTGQIPIDEAIQTGLRAGVKWFFVEQDVCKDDPIESITRSYSYLASKGFV